MRRSPLCVAFVVAAACRPTPPPGPPPRAAPAPLALAPTPAFAPTAFQVTVAGRGRPVILIPGLGCPPAVWDGTIAHLTGVETHALQLAGFAGAPPITAPLLATARAELVQYIRDRHLDHPIVIGHSLGGFLALWLAATAPDLVGPTIVVDSPAAYGADPAAAASGRDMAASWKAMTPPEFLELTRDMFQGMATDARAIEPTIRAVQRSDRRTFADSFAELFTTDPRAALPAITAPVLAVVADGPFQDTIRAQMEAVPVHDVVVLPKTRHFVMLDDAAGFYRAVDAFLAKHPPAR